MCIFRYSYLVFHDALKFINSWQIYLLIWKETASSYLKNLSSQSKQFLKSSTKQLIASYCKLDYNLIQTFKRPTKQFNIKRLFMHKTQYKKIQSEQRIPIQYIPKKSLDKNNNQQFYENAYSDSFVVGRKVKYTLSSFKYHTELQKKKDISLKLHEIQKPTLQFNIQKNNMKREERRPQNKIRNFIWKIQNQSKQNTSPPSNIEEFELNHQLQEYPSKFVWIKFKTL